MKMKFNWGTGVLIFLIVFIISVIAFFIFISSLDINLVEDNYYEKELAYQERIDKSKNTSSLPGVIKVNAEPGFIIIRFPQMDSTFTPDGSVLLYRPSDPKKDFIVPLLLNDSLHQLINIAGLDKGKWVVKIDWEMGGREYYFEESIFIEH